MQQVQGNFMGISHFWCELAFLKTKEVFVENCEVLGIH